MIIRRILLRNNIFVTPSPTIRNSGRSSSSFLLLQKTTQHLFSTSSITANLSNNTTTGSDHHQLYQEQLKELEIERNELFGSSSDSNRNTSNNIESTSNTSIDDNDIQKSIQEMNQEREELYNFSKEEKQAWGGSDNDSNDIDNSHTNTSTNNNTNHNHRHSPELMDAIHKAREAKALYESELEKETTSKVNDMADTILQEFDLNNDDGKSHSHTGGRAGGGAIGGSRDVAVATGDTNEENNPIFTHLNKKGEEVSMVDVGDKVVSKRIAVARSSVLFPPEVMDAFGLVNTSTDANLNKDLNEVIGPKGPIFATARLAGIMGAKRTSDLIPLCHPLPLSKVHIDIKLENNRALIECECRVTHKTGVEMEALAGASIAALTIYDMVKAVSHNVRIESTYLVKKSGGKRDVSSS